MATILLFLAVCFLAYANGANDNFKGVASLFGSKAANYRLALLWANAATLAGSLCSYLLAQGLLVKFSGKGLVPDDLVHSVPFITSVAGGAGATVILATRFGFPISTTHALLGAMAGSALVAADGSVDLSALGGNFILPLLLSPVVAVLLSILISLFFAGVKKRFPAGQDACICEDGTALPFAAGSGIAEASWFAAPQQRLHIGTQSECAAQQNRVLLGLNRKKLADGLHFLSAGAVCFARALNDTPKIAALLLLIPSLGVQFSIPWVALMMVIGGLCSAKRVAETMSHKITAIDHDQGLSANLTTAFLVIFASKFGMPVSTTHVSVGALFGIGLLSGNARFAVIQSILLSWVLTLPCAALVSAAIGAAGTAL